MQTGYIAIGAAFLAALVFTPLVRVLARRLGVVAQPKADRWHKAPTAMLGGVAIFLAVNVSLLATGLYVQTRIVIASSTLMFLFGLIDDFLRLRPYQKVVGQIAAAVIVIAFGYRLPWTGLAAVDMTITILWLVGITNAVNMLDNMDGLAAGVAAIAAVFAALNFLQGGSVQQAMVLGAFAAALLGFLVYNFNPASIFMGDCGSLFIGFFLASSVLMSSIGGRSRSLLAVLAVPVLILFIPIFDTTFVTILRKMAGRPASKGGRDHTSHRLVAIGLNERTAVLLLYALAMGAGAVAMLARSLPVDLSLALIGAFTIVITLLGIYLAGVTVYTRDELEQAEKKPIVAFLIDVGYKRRFFEVLLDVLLIVISYYLAYRLHFGPMRDDGDWQLFFQTLPLIIGIKTVVFFLTGLYRGLWRYVGFDDVLTFVKAVAAGTIACMLVLLFVWRFQGMSRIVFVLDALILLMLISASRGSFRMIRTLLRSVSRRDVEAGARTLIIGAGDGGELVVREIRNNPGFGRVPVGFLDDDPRKVGKVVHGLRVFGATPELEKTLTAERIEAVIVSTRLPAQRLATIVAACAELDIQLDELRVSVVPIVQISPRG